MVDLQHLDQSTGEQKSYHALAARKYYEAGFEQRLERRDKTFGLKNKKKSKAVQKFIKQVESNVENKFQLARKKAGDDGPPKPKKLSKKQREKQDRELAALLGMPVPRKVKKEKKKKVVEEKPPEEEEEEEEEDDWAKLPDAADLAKLAPPPAPAPAPAASGAGGSARASEPAEPEELTYEEELEQRRTNLLRKFDRAELTPMTFLSFMVWKSGRDEARRKAYAEADAEEAKRLGIKKNLGAKAALQADPSIFEKGEGAEADAADEDILFAADDEAGGAAGGGGGGGGSGPGGSMTLEEQFKAMLAGSSGDGDAMSRRAKTMAKRAIREHKRLQTKGKGGGKTEDKGSAGARAGAGGSAAGGGGGETEAGAAPAAAAAAVVAATVDASLFLDDGDDLDDDDEDLDD